MWDPGWDPGIEMGHWWKMGIPNKAGNLVYNHVPILLFFLPSYLSIFLSLSLSFFLFVFLGPHSWHTEVPGLGVQSEL